MLVFYPKENELDRPNPLDINTFVQILLLIKMIISFDKQFGVVCRDRQLWYYFIYCSRFLLNHQGVSTKNMLPYLGLN